MKSYMANKENVERKWHVVDADGVVLGRLASRVARILMGKHRAEYTPHADAGDFVVVTNCEKVRLTGRKSEQQSYFHYTGYPGGLRERAIKDVLVAKPEDPVYLAIRRMLPKTKLGKQMMRKLKVYAGPAHPHEAQNPEPLAIAESL